MDVSQWAIDLKLAPSDRDRLEGLIRSGSTPQKLVPRARIALLSDGTRLNGAIAREAGVALPTVHCWQRRVQEQGVDGLLRNQTRPSRIPALAPEVVERVVEMTLQEPSGEATHWSSRTMAAASGVSGTSVRRIWRAHGLKPHRVRTFKLSRDPKFAEKVQDVVGLYMNPPQHALVLSVDEKSQIQALERTQPGLPLAKGQPATQTHDYTRHGTTTLFAALNVLDSAVLGQCAARHRHQEFLHSLNAVEAAVPVGKVVHVILDNYAPHKHPKVRAWLEKHPRWAFHFTPTSASWLNTVDGFFAKLTRKRLRRGSFRGIVDLQAAIHRFIKEHNKTAKRFVWTADPDRIIANINKAKRALGADH